MSAVIFPRKTGNAVDQAKAGVRDPFGLNRWISEYRTHSWMLRQRNLCSRIDVFRREISLRSPTTWCVCSNHRWCLSSGSFTRGWFWCQPN